MSVNHREFIQKARNVIFKFRFRRRRRRLCLRRSLLPGEGNRVVLEVEMLGVLICNGVLRVQIDKSDKGFRVTAPVDAAQIKLFQGIHSPFLRWRYRDFEDCTFKLK